MLKTITNYIRSQTKSMKHYKRKTSIVEAVQWNGYNLQEVKDFTGSNADVEYGENNDNDVVADIIIHTNGCDVRLKKGDYIIKNVHGEFHYCEPTLFEETYEEA